MTKRELVGEVGVDSGTLFLVDPGYLTDGAHWKKQIPFLEKGAEREERAGNVPMANNLKRLVKEKTELVNLLFNWHEFVMKNMPHKIENCASGLIIPTHADGGYKVYAIKNKAGEITKVEIIF